MNKERRPLPLELTTLTQRQLRRTYINNYITKKIDEDRRLAARYPFWIPAKDRDFILNKKL